MLLLLVLAQLVQVVSQSVSQNARKLTKNDNDNNETHSCTSIPS